MDKPYFSVIMPIYNGEKFLSKAVGSLLNQTYRDFELIAVNDGSKDSTLPLLKNYEMMDSRVVVVNQQQNQGLCAARNAGLRRARGKYITFLDADDYIDGEMLEKIYEKSSIISPDAIKFGLVEEYYNKDNELKTSKNISLPFAYIICPKEIKAKILELEKIPAFGYTWNTMYLKHYITRFQLKFDSKYIMVEDFMFNLEYFKHVEKFLILSDSFYHYVKVYNSSSLSSKYLSCYYEMYEAKMAALYQFYEKAHLLSADVQRGLGNLYVRYVFSAIERRLDRQSSMSVFEIADWLKKTVFTSFLYCKLRPYMQSERFLIQCLCFCLKRKSTIGSIFVSYIIKMIKKLAYGTFIKLKG